jgi:hypothetical protein
MKNFPLLFCLVLFLGFAVSSQTKPDSSCPTIDISGGGIAKPGDTLTFTVNVENYDLSKLSFNWKTSSREIVEGQGTQSIKVLISETGDNTTVAVEIKGLPEGCKSTFYETAAPYDPPNPRLFDQFSIPASRIDKARLDNSVVELGENRDTRIFIIEYFKTNTPQRVIEQKIQKITDYLLYEKQLEKERFIILTAIWQERNWTKIWIVPPGAKAPTPDM